MAQEQKDNPSAFKHSVGPALLERMGREIAAVHPAFDRRAFEGIAGDLARLELKPRIARVRDELARLLPASYGDALAVLLAAARGGKLRGFDIWPFTDFVQTFGLDDRQRSLDALTVLTRLFTAEFAVRPFLRLYPEETLAHLLRCTASDNEHDRRWASEGSRPRLPWGERLQRLVADPTPTLPILRALVFDASLYVRKSVANHLNDIAKDHPGYVVETLLAWRREAKTADEKARLEWITRHALRTLIKAGHAQALAAIGVDAGAAIRVHGIRFEEAVHAMGDTLVFAIDLESLSAQRQRIVLDYAIHYRKANGTLSPKVFKWKTFELPPRGRVQLEKRHALREVTTRVHHPGAHALSVQVNGRTLETLRWTLAP
ncbi:DNA alkylation repair protein [Stenotrophomonas sp. MYb238]|uniref:DNA alkylation repair protein n=1 Tax=Stenotrophomonas sp. MYb238 TaxID=2040281 RepID=UPI0012912EDE|nr:DNA alkylation repair protein [Stenotrophomonas sp. MYb238]MQP76403.1 DNA alkylation repair protein [Stenotrophomonas sp. MYb238]